MFLSCSQAIMDLSKDFALSLNKLQKNLNKYSFAKNKLKVNRLNNFQI